MPYVVPRIEREWLNLTEAGAHIFEAAPHLDPNDICNALEAALREGRLKTRHDSVPANQWLNECLQIDWRTGSVTFVQPTLPVTLWRTLTPLVRRKDIEALFTRFPEAHSSKPGPLPLRKQKVKEFLRLHPDLLQHKPDAILEEVKAAGIVAGRTTVTEAVTELRNELRKTPNTEK